MKINLLLPAYDCTVEKSTHIRMSSSERVKKIFHQSIFIIQILVCCEILNLTLLHGLELLES